MKHKAINPVTPPQQSSRAVVQVSPPSTSHSSKCGNISQRRYVVLSQMAMNIGPLIPSTMYWILQRDSTTHLNLHANMLESLNFTIDRSPQNNDHDSEVIQNREFNSSSSFILEALEEVDVSSNNLGRLNSDVRNPMESKTLHLLKLSPYLVSLNLSANAFTSRSLILLLEDVQLPNLSFLDLSHNNIDSLVGCDFTNSFPKINTLFILNNKLRRIEELLRPLCTSTLQKLKLRDKNGDDANPVCDTEKYRYKVISIISSLEELDEERINESDRQHAYANVVVSSILDLNSEHFNSNTKPSNPGHKGLNKENERLKRNDYQDKRGYHTSNRRYNPQIIENKRQPQIAETKQQRVQKVVDTFSLRKLNDLEQKVRILTDLTDTQVNTTQHILRMNEDKNRENIGVQKKDQLLLVSDAYAQTYEDSSSDEESVVGSIPLPPPPQLENTISTIDHHKVKRDMTILLAFQKWENHTLKMQLVKISKCNINQTQMQIDAAVEKTKIEEKQKKEELMKEVNANMAKITQENELLKKQLNRLHQKYKTSSEKYQKLKSDYKTNIITKFQQAENEVHKSIYEYQMNLESRIESERKRWNEAVMNCHDMGKLNKVKVHQLGIELSSLKEQLKLEITKNDNLKSELMSKEEISKDNKELFRCLEEQKEETRKMMEKYDTLTKSTASHKVKYDNVVQTVLKSMDTIRNLKSQNSYLTKALDEKKKELIDSEEKTLLQFQRNKEYEKRIEDIVFNYENLRMIIGARDEHIEKLQEQIELLKNERNQQKAYFETLISESHFKQRQKDDFKTKYEDLKRKLKLYQQRAQMQQTEWERDYALIQEKNNQFIDMKKKFKKEQKKLEKVIENLAHELGKRDSEITNTREELDSLKILIEKKEIDWGNIVQNHNAALNTFQMKYQSLKDKKEDIENECKSLVSELSVQKSERKILEERINHYSSSIDAQNTRTRAALEGLCKELTYEL